MDRTWAFDLQLFGNAGLNYVARQVLTLTPNTTGAYATPLTGYGDSSQDTGPLMFEGANYSKLNVSMIGTGSGYTVTAYGCLDPVVFNYREHQANPNAVKWTDTINWPYVVPASSWFALDTPSDATGNQANPMQAPGDHFRYPAQLLAVRFVLTAQQIAFVGTCNIVANLIP